MKHIDTKYCYMDELCTCGIFYAEQFKNARNVCDRKMNNKEQYLDPDAHSVKLYRDLYALWHGKELPDGKGRFDLGRMEGCMLVRGSERFSSDYIGPSATEAFIQKVEDAKMGEIIKRCRTIGGHIIWPSHANSINQNKGKIYDRMDIALAELKDYYANPLGRAKYSTGLREAYKQDGKWLAQFGSFEGFCEFFLMVGSFVDEKYDIVWFASPKHSEVDYQCLAAKNVKAVERRNEKIEEYMK